MSHNVCTINSLSIACYQVGFYVSICQMSLKEYVAKRFISKVIITIIIIGSDELVYKKRFNRVIFI